MNVHLPDGRTLSEDEHIAELEHRGPTGKLYNGVVGRVDPESEDDPRTYVDPADSERVFISVTAAQGAATEKPHLREWHSKSAALRAIVEINELVRLNQVGGKRAINKYLKNSEFRQLLGSDDPDAAVKWIKAGAKRFRELKADIGTHQHNIFEALILDQPIPDCPEHLVGVEIDGERVDQDEISDGMLNFFEDMRPVPEMAEATVANTFHGYAGTLDMAGWFPGIRVAPNMPKGARIAFDLKTGKYEDGNHPAQIVAYKHCDEVWLPMGEKAAMPQVDLCGIIHLRKEYRRGYKLKLVDARHEQFYFDDFLSALRRFRFLEERKDQKRLMPFYAPQPDGSQPLPLLEDVTGDNFGRFRKILTEAGLDDIGDLSAMTERDVLQVKGIGVKAIEACKAVMARYGLTFAKERGGVMGGQTQCQGDEGFRSPLGVLADGHVE